MKHEDIISKLSLEDKASLLSGKNFWESMDLPEVGVPSMFLSDGPHGIRKQAAAADQLGLNPSLPATCFPTAVSMANSWNPELTNKVGIALGEEAVKLHVHMLLGPGINMKRNPRCGRSFEYFSEDPYLAGKLSAKLIDGIQSNGISACVKHWACNNQEERRINSDSVVDERALREIYTTAFEIAIKEGHAQSLMSSYNMVNGTYTNENQHLNNDILRKEFGFEGVIVSDWGGEADRIAGVLATNELEMPGNNGDTDREICRAVREGKLDEAVVNEAADNVIDLALRTDKVFENYQEPVGEIDGQKVTGMNCYPEMRDAHHLVAKAAADETCVLLKNDGTLPLKPTDKVVVIGDFAQAPRYQGAGSSLVNCTKLDNFVDLKEKYKFEYLGFAQGFDRYGKKNKKLVKEALELASKAEVIVYFMGLDEVTESEGLDRTDLNVHHNQVELLEQLRALNKKIVVILSGGSVIDLSWDNNCDALLNTSLAGQAGSNSILDIINGDVNPSGKTSETYICSYEDTPSKENFAGAYDVSIKYKESIYIGYRYFEKAEVAVKYPFGYGLSYTTFEYSDFKVTKDGVSLKITNTGAVAGKEVVQIYVGLKDSKIYRPVKELKGFKKTALLAPGESEIVEIPFDDKTFRYWNIKTNKWEIEGGVYDVYAAASVADIRATGSIEVAGTTEEYPYDLEKIPSYASGKIQSVSDEEFKEVYGGEWIDKSMVFYKKNRVMMTRDSLFCDLVFAKRWVGRLVGKVLRGLVNYGNKHNKKFANMIIMGPYQFPMRAISRMLGMSMIQADAAIDIFNGHFWRGLGTFIKGDKEAPKYPKDNHYQKPEKKKKK
ncbi:MAG: glycoside hydrolase family 3 C-terminal domain-containing protein [Bacilli bacterium]|nr:glycoside hydrolase family 3 C-terminal domain-containing protein [Bacilli bacterium]